MISVNILTTYDDTRKINKSFITHYSGVLCDIFEQCDLYKPVLRLSTGYATAGNYIYIPDFGRYYYIVNKTLEKAGYTVIECECDVLKSFASEILNTSQLILRSADTENENVKHSLVVDALRQVKPSTIFENVQITNADNITAKDNYILTVLSGSVGKFAQPVEPPEPEPEPQN